jgi:aspartyl-tRNA(Asn)/glutamyl-tRNA(Gln) amidotransferase subunit A
MTHDLPFLSIAEAGRRFRTGVLRPETLVEALLARIDARDGRVGAWVSVWREEALAAARVAGTEINSGQDRGPLHGIPVGIKDLVDVAGQPTFAGAPELRGGHRATQDAPVVTRLRAAGAVLLGKTHTHPLAMGTLTPTTRNPWDLERIPGGSSGGSAAALAAGMCLGALGSDTGGSIRQPAALCGVVGVKPTYGLVSRYGLIAFASSLDQIGPFATTVADAALLLDVIAGHDPMDSTSLSGVHPPASGRLDAGVDGLRVGLVTELTNAEGIAPDVVARVRQAADALAAAGAKVEEVSVPAAIFGLSAYYLIAPAEASSNLSRYDGVRYGFRAPGADITAMYGATRAQGFGAEVKRRIMLGTYALSAGYYDAYYAQAQRVRTLIIRDFEAAYRDFDVLLSPTAPTTAFAVGAKTADPLAMYLSDVCTIPSSLAGHPAMSVPFGAGADGLPVGVQVLAPALGEAVMFQVGAALESAAAAMEEDK